MSFVIVVGFTVVSSMFSGQMSFAQSVSDGFTPIAQINGASESTLSKAQSDGKYVTQINVRFVGADGVDVTEFISLDVEPDLSVKSADESGFQVCSQTSDLVAFVDAWSDFGLIVEPLQISLTDNSGTDWSVEQQSYEVRSGESVDVVYRNFDIVSPAKLKDK